uniref:translation initiation factor IF-2-like n=1 Tax=Nyctereutes procyonoides TaxID=34880 RepID=UPI0024440929|nr:translation initiation factor IF-2-like [Nyctereutes procyonoides]
MVVFLKPGDQSQGQKELPPQDSLGVGSAPRPPPSGRQHLVFRHRTRTQSPARGLRRRNAPAAPREFLRTPPPRAAPGTPDADPGRTPGPSATASAQTDFSERRALRRRPAGPAAPIGGRWRGARADWPAAARLPRPLARAAAAPRAGPAPALDSRRRPSHGRIPGARRRERGNPAAAPKAGGGLGARRQSCCPEERLGSAQ